MMILLETQMKCLRYSKEVHDYHWDTKNQLIWRQVHHILDQSPQMDLGESEHPISGIFLPERYHQQPSVANKSAAMVK